MLIQGDNLEALKALLPYFAAKVKCIYIDPPYNTGSAFEHYDDNLERSKWLQMMHPRLELLRELLSENGSIWISIDADESHYLKVICDEIFGRKNFVDEVVWQRSYAPINLKKTLSRSHDTILVYAKNSNGFELNKLPRSDALKAMYKNPDNDPRGVWKAGDLSVGPAVEKNIYEILTPSGRRVLPPKGRSWVLGKDRFEEFLNDNRIWFGPNGSSVPSIKRFLFEVKDGVTAMTWWNYQEVGHNQDAKKEVKELGFDGIDLGLTEIDLCRWLNARLRRKEGDVSQEMLLEFLRRVVRNLLARDDLDLAKLDLNKFLLEKFLREKIKFYQKDAASKAYQRCFFGKDEIAITHPKNFHFSFGETYSAKNFYQGRYHFEKHYYPTLSEMNSEEELCAKAIDENSNVKFWVKNVERQKNSFWLPTSSDKFYPDFVAQLNCGKLLVVEYKGADRDNEDSEEKELIGKVWAQKSGNLFLMAWKKDNSGRDVSAQIKHIINA